LRKPNKRNRWNCAPPPASRGSDVTRVSRSKLANCWLRCTGGLRRGSTRAI
jgi:hypothetical protein